MKDTDLYSQILGLSAPWVVDAVELNTVEGRVDSMSGMALELAEQRASQGTKTIESSTIYWC